MDILFETKNYKIEGDVEPARLVRKSDKAKWNLEPEVLDEAGHVKKRSTIIFWQQIVDHCKHGDEDDGLDAIFDANAETFIEQQET